MTWYDAAFKLPPNDEEDTWQSIDVLIYDGETIAMGWAEFPEEDSWSQETLWHDYSHLLKSKGCSGWPDVIYWAFLPEPPSNK